MPWKTLRCRSIIEHNHRLFGSGEPDYPDAIVDAASLDRLPSDCFHQTRTRAIVMQQKTGRPVQFELLPDA